MVDIPKVPFIVNAFLAKCKQKGSIVYGEQSITAVKYTGLNRTGVAEDFMIVEEIQISPFKEYFFFRASLCPTGQAWVQIPQL